PEGRAVANGRVAVERRVRKDGEWTSVLDGFFSFALFGRAAEHAAEHLRKGRKVMVTGRLRQDRWTNGDGETRSAVRIEASDVADLGYGFTDEPADDATDSD